MLPITAVIHIVLNEGTQKKLANLNLSKNVTEMIRDTFPHEWIEKVTGPLHHITHVMYLLRLLITTH
jgi:hypothetical protein